MDSTAVKFCNSSVGHRPLGIGDAPSRPVRGFRWLAVASIVLLMPAGNVNADTIFSNLGPSGQWGSDFDYLLAGENSPFDFDRGQDLAMRFTVQAGGPDYALTAAGLALRYLTGVSYSLNILLMDDAGGLPGAILETIAITGLPSSYALVSASSATNPVLLAGATYWLAADATGDLRSLWAPQYQQVAPPSTGVFRQELVSGGETPWLFISDYGDYRDAAYRISGDPLTQVPEPGTRTLLVLLTAGLILAVKRCAPAGR